MRKLTIILALLVFAVVAFAVPRPSDVASRGQNPFVQPVLVENTTQPACFIEPMTTLDEGFEGDTLLPVGWLNVDADSNGMAWFLYSYSGTAHSGMNSAATYYDTVQNDDWLISPAITVEESSHVLSWWAASQETSPDWLESYQVWISTSGTDLADFTDSVYGETSVPSEWSTHSVNLAPWYGETIYIAWRCTSWDDFILKVDDIHVGAASAYAFSVEPNYAQGLTAPETDLKFPVRIINQGMSDDSYGLTLAASGAWTVGVYDETGTTPMTVTGTIAPGDTANLCLKFTVPAVSDTVLDSASLEVTSIGDGSLVGDIWTWPIAVPPIDIPLSNTWNTEAEMYGWRIANTGDGTYDWMIVDTSIVGDTAFIGSMPYTITAWQESASVDIWLISPLLDFSGVTTAEISFDEMGIYTSNLDYHGIWTSTTGGSPKLFMNAWSEAQSLTAPDEGEYASTSVNLSDLAGEYGWIAFRYQGYFADIWFVDDIEINEGTFVDQSPLRAEQFELTGNVPNPFNAKTTIRANRVGEGIVEVFDINGRSINQLDIKGKNVTWDGTDFSGDEAPCGIYLYRLSGSNDVHRMIYLK